MSRARQEAAVELRKLIVRDGTRLLNADAAAGLVLVAVHHVHAKFVIAEGRQACCEAHGGYRRWVRRCLARDPDLRRFVGVIEPSLNVHGQRQRWQLGVHGVAAVAASTPFAALSRLRLALKTNSSPEAGVYRPLHLREIREEAGGVVGALKYATKSFEPDGVVRRESYYDHASRRNARSLPLTSIQRCALDSLMRDTTPANQVVLFGAKRLHGRITVID